MTARGVIDMSDKLIPLVENVESCRLCEDELPLGARPVLRVSQSAKILIVGQAPGTRVHKTGIPWNDPSGVRLRDWMGLAPEQFYDVSRVAIMPMGFCYPGKGASGDLAPRKECAPLWHQALFGHMAKLELVLLVGQYAQRYYLPKQYKNLTENVQHWQDSLPYWLPLPHPSPRNQIWLKRNDWFDVEVIPYLRERVKAIM